MLIENLGLVFSVPYLDGRMEKLILGSICYRRRQLLLLENFSLFSPARIKRKKSIEPTKSFKNSGYAGRKKSGILKHGELFLLPLASCIHILLYLLMNAMSF
jgi:hypothetical protein